MTIRRIRRTAVVNGQFVIVEWDNLQCPKDHKVTIITAGMNGERFTSSFDHPIESVDWILGKLQLPILAENFIPVHQELFQ